MKRKKIFISCLAAFTCLGVGAVTLGAITSTMNSVSGANMIIIDDKSFDDYYQLNDVLVVPAVDDLYFKNGSNTDKATYGQIIFPDGNSKTTGKYTLNEAGKYEISYFSNKGTSFTKEFIVNKDVYETTKGVTATFNNNLPISRKKGIEVELFSEGVFKFNRVVNLFDFNGNVVDVCNVYPIFRPTKSDKPAATFCTLKLVDAYDSSKFLEIYMWCDSSNIPYYSGAGSASQNFTGLEYNPNRPDKVNCYFEGIGYNKHITTRYQTIDAYGVWSNAGCNSELVTKNGLFYTWNLNNDQVWFGGSEPKLITDLDAPEVVDNNPLNPYEYFTTGEVYAQFQCFAFNTKSMKLEIVSLLGLSGDELKDDIIVDDKAPDIITPFVSEDNPQITISNNQRFFIPNDVTVLDYNYYGNLSHSIYYNYKQTDQISVYCEDYFTPDCLGSYTLVYNARDAYGNVGKKEITLNCVDSSPFTFIEKKSLIVEAACKNTLPFIDVKGRNGDVTVNVYTKDPDGHIDLLVYDEILNGYPFVPLYLGQYEISYEMKDAFYTNTFTYKTVSNDVKKVYFSENPSLYPYYIKGASYSLEPFYGLVATNDGPVTVESTPYINVDDTGYQEIINPNKFEINGNNEVDFKFVANDFEYIEYCKIIDVGFGNKTTAKDYTKYFQGNYLNATENSKNIAYDFADLGYMTLANLISLSNFEFDFTLVEDELTAFEIILSDYKNDENYITILLERLTSSIMNVSIVQTMGINEIRSSGYLNSSNKSNSFVITILGDQLCVYVDQTLITSIPLTYSFELSELSMFEQGTCTVEVEKVNNQNFMIKNKMVEKGGQGMFERVNGTFDLGEKYEVSELIPSCVLSPVLKEDVTVSVTGTNNEPVTSNDGLLLKDVSANNRYAITLNECGAYMIKYTVIVNGSNKTGAARINNNDIFEIMAVINVNDMIAPEVHFESNATLSIDVHDVIIIRNLSVSDNITAKEDLIIYILVVDDHYNLVENGFNVSSCAFHKKGNYKVVAYVFDEYGNYGTDSYDVIVK